MKSTGSTRTVTGRQLTGSDRLGLRTVAVVCGPADHLSDLCPFPTGDGALHKQRLQLEIKQHKWPDTEPASDHTNIIRTAARPQLGPGQWRTLVLLHAQPEKEEPQNCPHQLTAGKRLGKAAPRRWYRDRGDEPWREGERLSDRKKAKGKLA